MHHQLARTRLLPAAVLVCQCMQHIVVVLSTPSIRALAQCYKAVPALCVHMVKKTTPKGPSRLHVIRVLDAVIGKSLNKHGVNDKYGVRLDSSSQPSESVTAM